MANCNFCMVYTFNMFIGRLCCIWTELRTLHPWLKVKRIFLSCLGLKWPPNQKTTWAHGKITQWLQIQTPIVPVTHLEKQTEEHKITCKESIFKDMSTGTDTSSEAGTEPETFRMTGSVKLCCQKLLLEEIEVKKLNRLTVKKINKKSSNSEFSSWCGTEMCFEGGKVRSYCDICKVEKPRQLSTHRPLGINR